MEKIMEKLALPQEAVFGVRVIPAPEVMRIISHEDPTGSDAGTDYYLPKNKYMVVAEHGWRGSHTKIYNFVSNRYKPLDYSYINNSVNDVLLRTLNQNILNNMIVKDYIASDKSRMKRRIIFPTMTIEPQVNDIVRYGLEWSTSLNSTWAFNNMALADRLWCLNGCTTPDFHYHSYQKHTTNISLDKEASKMSNAIDSFYNSESKYKTWSRHKVVDESALQVFKDLASYKTNAMEETYSKKLVSELVLDWGVNKRSLGSTLWNLYNVLTAWASHPKSKGDVHNIMRNRNTKVSNTLTSDIWRELEDNAKVTY